ncbi:MAG: MlaD family protein, partial [Flammeovirgaceae bacterium]|nr:MlaD family protein [Flammeovirgaceae bacterium]
VGLLALVSGVLLYFGFNYLKGFNVFDTTHRYYTTFENTERLQVSNPVVINGVSVGQVTEITLKPEENGKIWVAFNVNQDIPLGKETLVVLGDDGLLGGKILKLLVRGNEKAPDNFVFPSATEKSLITLASEKAPALTDSVQMTVAMLNKILRDFAGTTETMKNTLTNTSALVATANKIAENNQQAITQTLKNLEVLTNSLVKTESELKPLIAKLNKIADSLNAAPIAQVAKDLDNTIKESQKTLLALNEAKGTMGKLLHDPLLYKNLNQSLADLDSLLIDFRKKPKRYVHFSIFGRKDK